MELLDEQVEYYRQRAGEYDEWWLRQGRYRLEPDARRRWFADVAEVETALAEFAPTGQVLEYAAGTGRWTRHLVTFADRVTAVDASQEMLDLNRGRLADDSTVRYVRADIFDWQPPAAAFDVAFFGYWLSHVPEEEFAGFWARVRQALRPGGRVFLVDSYQEQRLPGDIQERELNDGRAYRVVKRLWQPDELAAAVARLGFRLRMRVTAHGGILFGTGTPDDA